MEGVDTQKIHALVQQLSQSRNDLEDVLMQHRIVVVANESKESRDAIDYLSKIKADFYLFSSQGNDLPHFYINKEKATLSQVAQEAMPKKDEIDQRLKSLIDRSPIIVFMKGSPSQPKCGFTKQLLALLDKNKIVDFDSFDILEDEVVRQELKRYSNWPTYPQVYVKGELVGGLDVLKALEESGELESVFRI